MLEIRKWEPFKELSTIQKEMDEFFKRTFGSLTGLTSGLFRREWAGEWCPDVDCFMRDGQFVVDMDIPGVEAKDIDITVTGNLLTIKGERKSEVKEKKGGYLVHETAVGIFERTITLPEGVDATGIHASYKKGILELTMPAKAEALPKKIKVELEAEAKKAA